MSLCVQAFLHPASLGIGVTLLRRGLLVHLLLVTFSIRLEEDPHVE